MIQIDMTFLASVVNFILLTALLTFLLYRPIRRFMADRDERIRQAIEAAARARTESEALKGEYEARLSQATREAATIIEKATQQAEKAASDIIQQAQREATALIDRAKVEAVRERTAAFERLREDLVALVIAVSAKVAAESADSVGDEAIVRRLLEQGRLASLGEYEQ